MKPFLEKDLQSLIGNLLRIGVIIAMTIVIAGTFLFLWQHGKETADYSQFNEQDVFSFPGFFHQLMNGESTAIVDLGVMVLIATPVARVLFTMIGFWLEKDRLYTVIAFIVLCIIIFSMLSGATH